MRGRALIAVVAVAACAGAPKPVAWPAPGEVEAEVRTFLRHFENLEWEPFIAAFTDDACVFHPTARTPAAFCGRDAVRAKWQQVFDAIRAGRTAPPYQRLDPSDLRVTILGPDAALATFELHNAERTGRRSVVLVRRAGAWKILHIHASNVPWPDAP